MRTCRTRSLQEIHTRLEQDHPCVHGTDLSHKRPNYLENLQVIRDELGQSEYEAADTRNDCRWIMKSLIRGGLALVMDVERVYTRDLYPCYQLFAKHFEDQKSQMEQALELAIAPTSDATILLDFLSNFGSWMEEQARDWLNSNPTVDSL